MRLNRITSYKMTETERLILQPLTYDQLLKYARNDNSLDKEFNLNTTNRTISVDLQEALEETILPNVADKNKNYLFSTLWTAILKSEKIMVGDLCFIGEPNEKGEVEIGYGTYDAFQKKGYMTEALGGMIQWAKKQPDINSIVAATEKSNIASSLVLQKNNFIKFDETETLYHWRLKLK